ncbi:efflux RND transporter periplasmic adaptor subunit [Carboxylicivirga marina]|uniref:Efflux RND transporter periplasmic adaptor subunit n=1 Tax=Carboxylicivirga marina TaxID=2800988 RepID=A0ABS1HI97_9BACT|nr:efflux RND transporter periplasmic adaptor subunit [Carboxylicivirga marina]MBK3517018.1 efflux RND transporter periplasmic adaptor subunit [Carboxylicivirga marina]
MKTIFQNIKSNYKLVLGVLIVGLAIGWIVSPSGNANGAGDEHAGHNHDEEPTTWTCSMHPQIKQDKFGLCPICAMDLIPLSSMGGGENADPNEVVMSEAAAKLAEIQTSVVAIGEPNKSIYVQGKLHVDERRIAELTARFGGRIEELFVNFTGQEVRKGQKLATIYSPNLVSAQRELIEASEFKEDNPSLYKASRAKLKSWGLTERQVNKIEASGEPEVNFNVLSPITGTVTMRHVALGDYVKEGTALLKVADLSKLWVLFDAYETDLPWMKIGDKVNFTLQALPGEKFKTKVTYVDPFIDARTRVAKVRAEINNKELRLKPEMFASGVLESKIANEQKAVIIPKSAVLWTGKRSVVYSKVQDRESPTFLYREIVLGPEAGAFYVVKEGLEPGEEIATNGVFKIDAAAQLVGLPSMMNAPDSKNLKKETFIVAGNCEMCKDRIEKAAKTIYGVSSAIWNADSQTITIQFDPEKAELHDVHKVIANSGHDTEMHKADDNVYSKLPGCCLYERLDNTSKDSSGAAAHAMLQVSGNCDMCKERIEKAALSVVGVTKANWNADKQELHVNYQSNKANTDKIQKAIAKVGHDTEKYKADDAVYDALHGCCQYPRMEQLKSNNEKQHVMFNVGGNCGMCKDRIETAALTVEGVLDANWDKETKKIHINFSAPATEDGVQKAIAKAGHDTDKYKTDDAVYEHLHSCCKYERLK